MDPISQIFLQARAPTGHSNTGFEAWATGRQLGQRDRQIGLQEREQDALLQLRAQGEALQNQATGLDIELKILLKQREVDLKTARVGAAQLMLEAARSPDGYLTPGLDARIDALVKQVPAIVTDEVVGQPLMQNYRAARQWNAITTRAKAMGLEPTKATMDPKSGALVPTFGGEREFAPPKLIQLQRERERLQASGANPQALAEVEKAILNEQTETGEVIESLPGGGFRIVRGKGAAAGGPSVATTTKAAERITQAENALLSLNRSVEALAANPTATGPVGVTLEAFETLKGWLNPTAAPSEFPVTGTRNQLRETANTLIPMLKADSQMSNYERQKLESLTDQTDVTTSTPAARDALRRIQDAAVARALREIRDNAPGRQPSQSLLRAIRTEEEAVALVKEGLLTREQALQWYDLRVKDTGAP